MTFFSRIRNYLPTKMTPDTVFYSRASVGAIAAYTTTVNPIAGVLLLLGHGAWEYAHFYLQSSIDLQQKGIDSARKVVTQPDTKVTRISSKGTKLVKDKPEELIMKNNPLHVKNFLEAASKGDISALKALADKVDVNSYDPVSGRTGLHFAALNSRIDCYEWLVGNGAKEDIKDKMSFTPYELMLNPTPFHELFSEESMSDIHQHYRYVLSEKNCKLPGDARLVQIKRIEEINQFIEDHPDINRIGFIVHKPNILRRCAIKAYGLVRDIHVAPIYFERRGNTEYFTQLDSVFGKYFLIPASKDADKKRFLIYSPFNRQTSGSGCFEDAVVILLKILTNPDLNFLRFCTKNENRTSEQFRIHPLKKNEQERLLYLRVEVQNDFGLAEEYLSLEKREDNTRQARYYEKHKMNYVNAIFRLTRLPEFLLPHIVFYSTMRNLRVNQPNMFRAIMTPQKGDPITYLDYILRHGSLRYPQVVEREAIKENLEKDNPLFDFKGKEFPARQAEFVEYRKAMNKFIFTLFKGHFSEKTKENPERIASNIASFVTGMS